MNMLIIKRIVLLVAVFAAISCVDTNRRQYTTFDVKTTDPESVTFAYMAMSTVFYPTSSEDAEAFRMKMLQEWLDLNELCRNGFQITSKRYVSRGDGPDAKNIYYVGKCKQWAS